MASSRPQQRFATGHLTYFVHAIAFVGPYMSDSRAHVASDPACVKNSTAHIIEAAPHLPFIRPAESFAHLDEPFPPFDA